MSLIRHCDRLLLLSDLHLSDQTPGTLAAVLQCINTHARRGSAFVFLGDIFEYWIGDDCQTGVSQAFATACQQAARCGSDLYFMAGNRDFLVGPDYLGAAGITALPDPWHGTLFGVDTLLSHGDLLCTDDTAYQQFRSISRNPAWQADFLGKPLDARMAYAQQLRAESMKNKATTDLSIMDVNEQAVALALDGRWPLDICTAPAQRLIHGHTHRPAVHALQSAAGRDVERWVLPDWDFEHGGTGRGYPVEMTACGIRSLNG